MPVAASSGDGVWQVADSQLAGDTFTVGTNVFLVASAQDNSASGNNLHKISGIVVADGNALSVVWDPFAGPAAPRFEDKGVYGSYVGATLTALAFDTVQPGLGKWLVTIASWLFAFPR